MLIDLAAWRSHRCTERILAELEHPSGPNPLGDQDIIVRVFPQETCPLDPKWNFLSQFFMLSYKGLRRIVGEGENLLFSAEAFKAARRCPVIYHFSGQTLGRPWFTSSRHPMRKLYQAIARSADLASAAEQVRPMPAAYRVQYLLYRLFPQRLFDRACWCLYRLHIRLTYKV
jgi:lipopolysaccharide biosynthesis glycosyltransferase